MFAQGETAGRSSNRRISLIVQCIAKPELDEEDSNEPAKAQSKEAGKDAAREPEKKH